MKRGNRMEKWRHDDEYMHYVRDIMCHQDVQKLKTITHHIYTNRLAHSIAVSYNSYKIAKRFKLDARAVARAGLLHDLFFYDCKNMVYSGAQHNRIHPQIALKNAQKITTISLLEADIILKHMCGVTLVWPKYVESAIVALIDKQVALVEVTSAFTRNYWQKVRTYFA